MRKTIRKFTSILVSLCMVISMVPLMSLPTYAISDASASAADGADTDDAALTATGATKEEAKANLDAKIAALEEEEGEEEDSTASLSELYLGDGTEFQVKVWYNDEEEPIVVDTWTWDASNRTYVPTVNDASSYIYSYYNGSGQLLMHSYGCTESNKSSGSARPYYQVLTGYVDVPGLMQVYGINTSDVTGVFVGQTYNDDSKNFVDSLEGYNYFNPYYDYEVYLYVHDMTSSYENVYNDGILWENPSLMYVFAASNEKVRDVDFSSYSGDAFNSYMYDIVTNDTAVEDHNLLLSGRNPNGEYGHSSWSDEDERSLTFVVNQENPNPGCRHANTTGGVVTSNNNGTHSITAEVCSDCGETVAPAESAVSCTYGSWNASTGTRTCTVCGYTETCSHSKTTGGVTISNNDGTHYTTAKICSTCGKTVAAATSAVSCTYGTSASKKNTCTACGYIKAEAANEVDFSWYTSNTSATTFNISSAAGWRALAWLTSGVYSASTLASAGYVLKSGTTAPADGTCDQFSGDTINLTADINLNNSSSLMTMPVSGDYYINDDKTLSGPWGNSTSYDHRFKGSVNGNGHTITGIYMAYQNGSRAVTNRVRAGLFGWLGGGTSSTSKQVIQGIRVKGTITSTATDTALGGIVGCAKNVSNLVIKDCINEVNLTGAATVGSYTGGLGGIAGILNNNSNEIQNCLNLGKISGTGTATKSYGLGGLVGSPESTTIIKNSLNMGTVTTAHSTYKPADIMGYTPGTMTNCYYSGTYAAVKSGTTVVTTGATKTSTLSNTTTALEAALNTNNADAWTYDSSVYTNCPVPTPFASSCQHTSTTGGAVTSKNNGTHYTTAVVCSDCGETITPATSAVSCTYGSWDASTGKRTCTACGYAQTCSHASTTGGVVTSNNNGTHYTTAKICSTCGKTVTSATSATSCTYGSWDASTGKRTCTACGYVNTCTHATQTGGGATSTGSDTHNIVAKVCSTCGKTTAAAQTGISCTFNSNHKCTVCNGEERHLNVYSASDTSTVASKLYYSDLQEAVDAAATTTKTFNSTSVTAKFVKISDLISGATCYYKVSTAAASPASNYQIPVNEAYIYNADTSGGYTWRSAWNGSRGYYWTTGIQSIIMGTAHTSAADAAVAATCTDTGLTAGAHCSVCGTVLTNQTVTQPLGHDYTYSYSWASDGSSCTATATCSRDSSHVVTATGTITSKVKTAATCTTKGTTTYTAKFTDSNGTSFAQQTKDVQDIAAAGHVRVVSEKGVAATCTLYGSTDYVICKVCKEVLQRHELISPTGHSFTGWVVDESGKVLSDACTSCKTGNYVDLDLRLNSKIENAALKDNKLGFDITALRDGEIVLVNDEEITAKSISGTTGTYEIKYAEDTKIATCLVGDADGNGEITSADAGMMILAATGVIFLEGTDNAAAWAVEGEGYGGRAVRLLSYLAGKQSTLR